MIFWEILTFLFIFGSPVAFLIKYVVDAPLRVEQERTEQLKIRLKMLETQRIKALKQGNHNEFLQIEEGDRIDE